MKSVSLRTRLEEPAKHFVFCKGSKLQVDATLRGENKCCRGNLLQMVDMHRNIARIANAVQVTICLLVSTSVY